MVRVVDFRFAFGNGPLWEQVLDQDALSGFVGRFLTTEFFRNFAEKTLPLL
jgi:hypothetical protein